MFNQNQLHRTTKLNVARIIIQRSGTYNTQYSRPYQAFMNNSTMNDLMEKADQVDKVTGDTLAGMAGSIISPSVQPQNRIYIPNDWNEQRAKFILEVHEQSSGTPIIHFLQGFTDYYGINPATGTMDSKMRFTINSFVRVNRAHAHTPTGIQVQDIITDNAHVINGQIFREGGAEHTYSMRPQDIFAGMQAMDLDSAYIDYNNQSLMDTRVELKGNTIRSRRDNNLPSRFLATLIEGYKNTVPYESFGQNGNSKLDMASSMSSDGHPRDNTFLRVMRDLKNSHSVTSFTFDDLLDLDPNTKNVVNCIDRGQATQATLHQHGQTCEWHGVNRETVMAVQLSNAIPSLMMDLLLSKLAFSSTNYHMGGEVTTVITEGASLSNVDLRYCYERFKFRLEKEVLFDLTYGNQELYSIAVNADLFGDIVLNISFAGGPMYTYVTPAFCDSLLSPVITNYKDNYVNVVSDLSYLINNISPVNLDMMSVNRNI